MSRKKTDERVRAFGRAYLDTLDARRAEADGEDGYELLERRDVQHYIAQARRCARAAVEPEDVVRCLCRIAFSRPNDAVALACGQKREAIEGLDLAAVAEFKCKGQDAEVKFLDRVRALQALGELLLRETGERGDDAALDFLNALQSCAGAAESEEEG